MPRPRRSARGRRVPITPGIWAYLAGQPKPADEPERGVYSELEFFGNVVTGYRQIISLEELWRAYRDDVMVEWIRARPGTRPRLWWRFDAPAPRRICPAMSAATGTDTLEPEAEYLDRRNLLTQEERLHVAL